MDLKYWAATDVGRKRTHNEDNFLIDQELRFFVVADGMGGHASGEVASAMAVHTIRGILAREHDLFEQARDDDPTWHMEICMLLEYAVHIACEQIYSKGVQEPEKKGMGTTVVSLLIVGDRGYIAYVGDSRIYLLRGGIVYQLTEDHSLMNELIRQGKITAEAFDDSPYAQFKHAMTRAVGPNEAVEVDTLDFDMIPGDSFLLCSDGLYEYLDDSDISHMLALTEVKDIPGRLIDMANTRGGKDNITALIIQVPENADGSDRAAEINFTLDTLKSIPLFAALTYQQLVRIMNLTRIVPFEAGNVLCYEGQPAEELFVILRGLVELESSGSHVATLPQGSHFGEMALVGTTPRSATATAVADGKLLIINREDFFEILRKEAPLAVKLLWAFVQELSSRLRQANLDLSEARDPSSARGHLEHDLDHDQGHGAPDEVMEIMDLSEEIVVSESSSELSRAELAAALDEDTVREPSDTISLDPNDMDDLDELEDLDDLDTLDTVDAAEAVELDADEVLAVQVQAPSEPTAAAAPSIAAPSVAPPPPVVAPPPVIVDPSTIAERDIEAPASRVPKSTIPILVNPTAGRFGNAGKPHEDAEHHHASAQVDAPDLLPDE